MGHLPFNIKRVKKFRKGIKALRLKFKRLRKLEHTNYYDWYIQPYL